MPFEAGEYFKDTPYFKKSFCKKKKNAGCRFVKKTQCDDPKLSDWDGWLELELKCHLQDPEG